MDNCDFKIILLLVLCGKIRPQIFSRQIFSEVIFLFQYGYGQDYPYQPSHDHYGHNHYDKPNYPEYGGGYNHYEKPYGGYGMHPPYGGYGMNPYGGHGTYNKPYGHYGKNPYKRDDYKKPKYGYKGKYEGKYEDKHEDDS